MQKKDFKALARILAVSKICEKSDNENLSFLLDNFSRVWDNFNPIEFLDWYEDYLNNPTRTINGDARELYVKTTNSCPIYMHDQDSHIHTYIYAHA